MGSFVPQVVPMKCIGITGGIGCGKSTVGKILLRHTPSLIDVDDISRRLTSTPGSPAVLSIAECFGPEFLDDSGAVDRLKMADLIFSDSDSRQRLERILHPLIRTEWLARVQCWKEEGVRIGYVIVPLLFEAGLVEHFDEVVCVACGAETQLDRLRARSWSDDEAKRRISSQISIASKMALSDLVIWTDTTIDLVETQVARSLISSA